MADQFEVIACDDPTCGTHLVLSAEGQRIAVACLGDNDVREVVELLQKALYARAVERSG